MGPGWRGVAPQTAKREQFGRLIASGAPDAEACRMVGINRRTGTRWRHGREITSSSGRRLHYPPVITTRKKQISERYLSEDERVRIADLHRAGHTVRSVATELAVALRRSAGSCAATPTPKAGSTGRSPRTGWPSSAELDPDGAS